MEWAMLLMTRTTLIITNLADLGDAANILVRTFDSLWCLPSIKSNALEVSWQILLVQRRNIHLKVLIRLPSVCVFLKLLTVLCKVSSLWRSRVSVEIGKWPADLGLLIWLILFIVRRVFRVVGNKLLFLVPRTVNNTIWNARRRSCFYFETLVTGLWVIRGWELFGGFEEGLVPAVCWVWGCYGRQT